MKSTKESTTELQMPAIEQWAVSRGLIEHVRRYLGARPHDEVANLIAALNAEILPQMPQRKA